MPYKDPEKRREADRRYKAANRGRLNEQSRETMRRLREADPERDREYQRRRRQENPELYRGYARQSYERNRDRILERNRNWRKATKHRNVKDRQRAEIVARLWKHQCGRCYLCEDPVELAVAVLEHDHRCCPPAYFCHYCIRGVSCPPCNYVIGFGRDDPARLEVIARNLRVKLAEIDGRLASKPEQAELTIQEG
jgi:hypothetical protein